MFDIGFSELLVIAAVALLVLGPDQLPGVMLKLGRFVGGIKRQLNHWQQELEEAALDAEIKEHNARLTREQTRETLEAAQKLKDETPHD